MPDENFPQPSFEPSRRWKIGLNVLLSLGSLLVVVVIVNYLAARHFRRWQWAPSSHPPISLLTLRVLNSLTNTVKVVVIYDRREPLYNAVRELLDQYKLKSRRIEVEYIDWVIPGRTKRTCFFGIKSCASASNSAN